VQVEAVTFGVPELLEVDAEWPRCGVDTQVLDAGPVRLDIDADGEEPGAVDLHGAVGIDADGVLGVGGGKVESGEEEK